MAQRCLLALSLAITTVTGKAACAQTTDNALATANDAFGASVGQETIGIYNENSVRGFDPTAAGNVRVEGLYVDLPGGVSDHVAKSTLIRVGIANIGTLLAAPSGIVDISLRDHASAWQGRGRASSDDLGYSGIEFDASGPLSDTIGIAFGASLWGAGNDYRGVDPQSVNFGGILSAGGDDRKLQTYVSFERASLKVEPWFYPSGNVIPQRLPRDTFLGQKWSHYGYDATTVGVVGRWRFSGNATLRAEAAFSQSVTSDDTFDLVEDWAAESRGQRSIYRVPGNVSRAFSGEMQMDWTLAEGGGWSHRASFGLRGRKAHATFGGDVLAASAEWSGTNTTIAEPGGFEYGTTDKNDDDQVSAILGWKSKSERLGFFSVAIAPTYYRQRATSGAGGSPAVNTTKDILYSGIIGINFGRHVTTFLGTSRGIEASGIAPISATNRGEVLSAVTTRQYDAGVRMAIGTLTSTLAAFDISRPYPIELADGRYALAGRIRHRGLEGSIAGQVTKKLNALAGFYLLGATLSEEGGSSTRHPIAVPNFLFQMSAELALSEKLNVDATVTIKGPRWLQSDGNLRLPTTGILDLGLRYVVPIFGAETSLRVRLTNAFNQYSWRSASDGGISPAAPRRLSVNLTKGF